MTEKKPTKRHVYQIDTGNLSRERIEDIIRKFQDEREHRIIPLRG